MLLAGRPFRRLSDPLLQHFTRRVLERLVVRGGTPLCAFRDSFLSDTASLKLLPSMVPSTNLVLEISVA